MYARFAWVAGGLLLVCVTAPLHAGLIPTALPSVVATDDTFVRGGAQADTKQAYNHWLECKDSLDNSRRVYLKFALSGFEQPPSDGPGATALAAPQMELFLRSALAPGANYDVDVYGLRADYSPPLGKLGHTWTEDQLTWNTAPGTDASGNLAPTAVVRIGTLFVPQSSDSGLLYSVPLTGVDSIIQPDGSATLILSVRAQSAFSPSLVFESSESTSGPAILVPEPATGLMLLAAVGMAVALYRRWAGV